MTTPPGNGSLFGKDRAQLQNVPSFRATATNFQHSAPRKQGGGGKPHFVGEYKPNRDEMDLVRLIPGRYDIQVVDQNTELIKVVTMAYFPAVEHKSQKTMKTAFCSAGPWRGRKGKGEPCLGCDIFWGEFNDYGPGDVPGKTMSANALNVFTVLDYSEYVEVPQVNRKTGQASINRQTGQPWTEWVKVMGRNDPNINRALNRKRGHVQHWGIPKTHLTQLLAYAAEINKSCKNCHGVDTIEVQAYLCPHCSEVGIDLGTTTMNNKDIEAMTLSEVVCRSCKQKGWLQPYFECSSCTNAQMAGLFDVDLKLRRVISVGEKGKEKSTLTFGGYSPPRDIDQAFVADAKPKPIEKIYAPTPFALQQELFGMQSYVSAAPQQSASQEPAARAYGSRVLQAAQQSVGGQPETSTNTVVEGEFEDDNVPY